MGFDALRPRGLRVRCVRSMHSGDWSLRSCWCMCRRLPWFDGHQHVWGTTQRRRYACGERELRALPLCRCAIEQA